MNGRRSEFDVTNRINVTEVEPVAREVCRLYQSLYPDTSVDVLQQAFSDIGRLFRGDYPGYLACEAPYHDLQHTLDVTLAATRLLAGYERKRLESRDALGQMGVLLGILCALYHDSGYIRRSEGEISSHGAELTITHVSRGGEFLHQYLPTIGLQHASKVCSQLLHFTGYEMPVQNIEVNDPKLRRIGMMIGTADLLAQMSDRCYLEKCRDRLYPEFVASGMASSDHPSGGYKSGDDLICKTPAFFRHVLDQRLEHDFESVYRYLEDYFEDGRNLYMEAVEQNRKYLLSIVTHCDVTRLRRCPLWTLNDDIPMLDVARYGK